MHTNSSETIKGKFKDTKTSFELKNKTIEIETITKEKTDYQSLCKSLINGFEKEFEITFTS